MLTGKPPKVEVCPKCGLTVASHTSLGECSAPLFTSRPVPDGLGPDGGQRWQPIIQYTPPPERPGDPRFHLILKELADLHDRKQADYGREQDPLANIRASAEWGVQAWVGALIRLNDKVRRLQAFARRGTLANEGAVDSLNDIAVYAILARILLEEGQAAPAATKGDPG